MKSNAISRTFLIQQWNWQAQSSMKYCPIFRSWTVHWIWYGRPHATWTISWRTLYNSYFTWTTHKLLVSLIVLYSCSYHCLCNNMVDSAVTTIRSSWLHWRVLINGSRIDDWMCMIQSDYPCSSGRWLRSLAEYRIRRFWEDLTPPLFI